MKKKIVTMGFVLFSVALLSGCGRNRELTRISSNDMDLELLQSSEIEPEVSSSGDSDADNLSHLTALADTREAAQEIADLYEIELNSYSYGVATYTTDKNLRELLDLGLEKGYPELTPDYKNQLHTTQTSE